MSRKIACCTLLFLLVSVVLAQADSDFLPAGMLLNCTMDEPNLSAKTAEVGDPVLCYLGSTAASGRIFLPRGSFLSGRMSDAAAPGHFFGKGSLSLEFDRLVLPGQAILPLTTKVIAVPHYKVDRTGKIDGKGHPRRDAVEWMLPVLWPVKILTLPARGPYPALKGETRLTLRLMEDVAIPVAPKAMSSSVPMPPWAHLSYNASLTTANSYHVVNAVAQEPERTRETTVIVLKDETALLVSRYGLDGDVVRCELPTGAMKSLAMSDIDFGSTIRINRQRGVGFILQSPVASEQ